jgi:hypothetical protein
MASLPHDYRLQLQTVTELNRLAEVLVPATFRFFTHKDFSSLLQVHGQRAVCPGVAEVTSLARILRSLLDPHLRLYEEEKVPDPGRKMEGLFFKRHEDLRGAGICLNPETGVL